ncbi:hypothetical protein GJ496_009013 [Pomphorhynchus laevis]|nr:hypothetical protein GJ496_009013 [Pomphorhynchus laevis]
MDQPEFEIGTYDREPVEKTIQPPAMDPFTASSKTIAGRLRRRNTGAEQMVTRSRSAKSASPPDNPTSERSSDSGLSTLCDDNPPNADSNASPVEAVPTQFSNDIPAESPASISNYEEIGSCIPLRSVDDVQSIYEKHHDVFKMGYNSITGLQAIEWTPSASVSSYLSWFANIRQRQRTGRARARNAINAVEGEQIVFLSRPRATAVQDISVEFTAAPRSATPVAELFTKYYRGLLIDQKYIASDIQGTLRISKNLAGYLTSAITMGVGDSSLASFYTVGWALYIHRAWFALNNIVPVLPAIAEDSMNMIGLDPEVAKAANVGRDIINAIEAGDLVLLANDYSPIQLAVIRLLCNGLPRLAAPADAVHLPILDNFITPKMNVTLLYHGVQPVLPQAVPTCSTISQTLINHAVLTASNDDCFAGLVRACVTCFFHNGGGDVNCLINGFCEYRRLAWPVPRFRNPFYEWLKLHDQTSFPAERHELTEALLGPLVDIYRSFVITNMVVSIASGVVFHRWSMPSNILQLYMTNNADVGYGNAATFLRYRLVARTNRITADFFQMVYMVIKDLCHDNLPYKAFNISVWNAGTGVFVLPIAAGHGWIGGWDRQIVYPCQPYTVLWAFNLWPSIWGYLAAPITLSIDKGRCSVSRNADARFNVTRGDDLFMSRVKTGAFFFTTGYSTAVLSAISQNCRVEAWNRPAFIIFDREQREDGLLPAASIEPALVYDAPARLVRVGSLWHYDWNRQQGFGLRWDYEDLPARVRLLVEFRAIHLMMAGVSSSGQSQVFNIDGYPSNLDIIDDYDLESAPNKKVKNVDEETD